MDRKIYRQGQNIRKINREIGKKPKYRKYRETKKNKRSCSKLIRIAKTNYQKYFKISTNLFKIMNKTEIYITNLTSIL